MKFRCNLFTYSGFSQFISSTRTENISFWILENTFSIDKGARAAFTPHISRQNCLFTLFIFVSKRVGYCSLYRLAYVKLCKRTCAVALVLCMRSVISIHQYLAPISQAIFRFPRDWEIRITPYRRRYNTTASKKLAIITPPFWKETQERYWRRRQVVLTYGWGSWTSFLGKGESLETRLRTRQE